VGFGAVQDWLGASLARVQLRTNFIDLLERAPDVEVGEPRVPRRQGHVLESAGRREEPQRRAARCAVERFRARGAADGELGLPGQAEGAVHVTAAKIPSAPEPPSPPVPRVGRRPAFVTELGGMCHLAWLTFRAMRPPYTWTAEFVSQFRFTLGVCWFPMVLCAFALSFGPAGVQAGNFFGLLGAYDRMGSVWVLIAVRVFAPLVTAIVLAGAAGTAICADLGARVVREETDALRVMGVDPVRNLVVPRVLALTVAGILFTPFVVLAGMLGAIVVLMQNDAPLGPFFANFFANASPLEISAALLKTTLYGATIAIVCCYKGSTVSGGPEGVGRAVNRAVVIAFLLIGFIDYFFSQLLLATHPDLSSVRG
jgi:phospholipid/cholesterol/gamma-HCH transport system permease protein